VAHPKAVPSHSDPSPAKSAGQRTNEQMMLGCSSTQMWLDKGYMMRIQGGYNIEIFHVGVFENGV